VDLGGFYGFGGDPGVGLGVTWPWATTGTSRATTKDLVVTTGTFWPTTQGLVLTKDT